MLSKTAGQPTGPISGRMKMFSLGEEKSTLHLNWDTSLRSCQEEGWTSMGLHWFFPKYNQLHVNKGFFLAQEFYGWLEWMLLSKANKRDTLLTTSVCNGRPSWLGTTESLFAGSEDLNPGSPPHGVQVHKPFCRYWNVPHTHKRSENYFPFPFNFWDVSW